MIIKTFTLENELSGEITEHVIIDRDNNEFTSMPKSVYDEMQAKQNERMSK